MRRLGRRRAGRQLIDRAGRKEHRPRVSMFFTEGCDKPSRITTQRVHRGMLDRYTDVGDLTAQSQQKGFPTDALWKPRQIVRHGDLCSTAGVRIDDRARAPKPR